MKRHEIVEILAAAWREIGQPEITSDLRFIIQEGSEIAKTLHDGPDPFDIPILFGNLHGSESDITVVGRNLDYTLILKFESEIRGLL